MRRRLWPAAARTYRRNFRRDAGEAEAPGEPRKGPGPRRWRSGAPAVRRCSRGPWWALKGRPAEHERRAAGGEGGGGGGLLRLLRSAGRGCCPGSGGTEDAGKVSVGLGCPAPWGYGWRSCCTEPWAVRPSVRSGAGSGGEEGGSAGPVGRLGTAGLEWEGRVTSGRKGVCGRL